MTARTPLGVDYFNRAHPLHGLEVRVALRARRRMFARTMRLIDPGPDTRILDVGTTPDLTIRYNNLLPGGGARPPAAHPLAADGLLRALWRSLGLGFWADEANLRLLALRGVKPLLPPFGCVTIRLVWSLGWPSNIEIAWSR